MKQEVFARISLNNQETQALTEAYDILEKVAKTAEQLGISVENVNDACRALTEILWRDECIWINRESSGE